MPRWVSIWWFVVCCTSGWAFLLLGCQTFISPIFADHSCFVYFGRLSLVWQCIAGGSRNLPGWCRLSLVWQCIAGCQGILHIVNAINRNAFCVFFSQSCQRILAIRFRLNCGNKEFCLLVGFAFIFENLISFSQIGRSICKGCRCWYRQFWQLSFKFWQRGILFGCWVPIFYHWHSFVFAVWQIDM